VAIFGFCDIRKFTDITEILQEGVMSFVNTIAHIVHSEVHSHNGCANKNIGDAFLLVWKFREGFSYVSSTPARLPSGLLLFLRDQHPLMYTAFLGMD
jgi:class 3 adenylate cyclase